MKKFLKAFFIACCVILISTTIIACRKLSDAELLAVGRYDLTAIHGESKVLVSDFDYNHILLDEEGKFKIENKSAGVEYIAKGKWSLDGETLTMKMSGAFTKKETHQLKDNKILLFGELDGKEITLEYTKANE